MTEKPLPGIPGMAVRLEVSGQFGEDGPGEGSIGQAVTFGLSDDEVIFGVIFLGRPELHWITPRLLSPASPEPWLRGKET